uniref:Tensin-4 n=1 Tax=Mesocestoides corti TaxID=53468 RepID=A0A5K3FYV8_MESCO
MSGAVPCSDGISVVDQDGFMDLSKKTDIIDSNTVTTPSGSCSDSDDLCHLQQQSSGNSPQPSQHSSTHQSKDAALGISEICDPVTVAKCSPRSPQPTECRTSPRATPAECCGDITGQSCQSLDVYSEVNKAPAQPFNTVNAPSAPSGQGSIPPSYVQHPCSPAAPKSPPMTQTGPVDIQQSEGNKENGVDTTLSAASRCSPTYRDVGQSAPLSTPTTTASGMSQDSSGSTDETDWRASFDQEHRDHVVRR